MAKACHVLCLAWVVGTGQLFVPRPSLWPVARVAPRALAEPEIDKWLETLESTEGWAKGDGNGKLFVERNGNTIIVH